ncbi:MAG: branched-chain-amino-acid transaminase [Phycisphaerales bacterium]|nr:branched-chain-amino-acid transaminase [Phycisphaerales bacterium]
MNSPPGIAPLSTVASPGAKPSANGHSCGCGSDPCESEKIALGATPWKANFAANTFGQGEKPLIFVNGDLVPKSQAMVSVYDHGLLYGDGVFEGIRVYRGSIFKCQQHIDRLWRSADGIKLKIPMSQQEMVDMMRLCITANGLSDGYIRLLVTRGAGSLGLNPFKCPIAGVICVADQIALYPKEMYDTGMRVVVAKRPRVPIPCLDPRIKSLNYLNNILAKTEAIEQGCLEAIMLNLEGYVTECTGDNIFAIKEGVLYTPPSEAGILEGVTRRFVVEQLCPHVGIEAVVKPMRIEDFYTADEVFLTGSAAEIIAVTQIGDRKVGAGAGEGSSTKKLRKRFREVVTSDHVPED